MESFKKKILHRRTLAEIFVFPIVCVIGFGVVVALGASNGTVPTGPTVIFNGSVLHFKDDKGNKLAPVMIDGQMYLPADGVANLLGIQHQELDENVSVWYDSSAKAMLENTKEGLLAGHRVRVSSDSVILTLEHTVNQTVSMAAVESARAFNTMWINIPEGRTGSMILTVGNTGKGHVRETRTGAVVSSSAASAIEIDFTDPNDPNVNNIQQAKENDQLEEAKITWDGMPLTVSVYNDATNELLAEARLGKGHQVESLTMNITGVKTLRVEANPDIENWRADHPGSAENDIETVRAGE